jgi:hypothetical protein
MPGVAPLSTSRLRWAGLPAICIETRRMKGANTAMAVKTDRKDARAIAQAMRLAGTALHVNKRRKARSSAFVTKRDADELGRCGVYPEDFVARVFARSCGSRQTPLRLLRNPNAGGQKPCKSSWRSGHRGRPISVSGSKPSAK